MDNLIYCTVGLSLNLKAFARKQESIEIYNLETKAQFDDPVKDANSNHGNIINTKSWKFLSHEINLIV